MLNGISLSLLCTLCKFEEQVHKPAHSYTALHLTDHQSDVLQLLCLNSLQFTEFFKEKEEGEREIQTTYIKTGGL